MNSSRAGATTPRRRGRPRGRTAADGVIADRNRLLEAAEEWLRTDGPTVSLQAIATRAGVTKPTLYRELGDRDALVNALAERLAERMAASVTSMVATATDPRDGLHKLVMGYLDLAERDRNLYLFVTAGGPGDDRVQQALRLADGAAHQFAEPIAAFRASQGVDPEVATVWSYGLLGALHFVTLWWLRDEAVSRDVVASQIISLLWSGMAIPGS